MELEGFVGVEWLLFGYHGFENGGGGSGCQCFSKLRPWKVDMMGWNLYVCQSESSFLHLLMLYFILSNWNREGHSA
jgi:hypothetical protein